MEGDLGDFPGPVHLIKVDETKWEALWDDLVRQHHYLGYESVIGGRAKYLMALGDRVVGAISFCSAAYKLGLRDKYVGWDKATRLAMLPHLVNNNRFLILPWVRVRNLASHALSESLKRLRTDWERLYGVEPFMAETFVDPERFSGSCYAAANWIRLGQTKGYGRQGNGFVFHGHVKDLWIKVMNRRFASVFRPDIGRLPVGEREEFQAMIYGTPVFTPEMVDHIRFKGLNPDNVARWFTDHLFPYKRFMNRKESIPLMAAMLKGLMSGLKRKSLDPIASNFLEKGQFRALVNFMSDSDWDDEGMLEFYQADLAGLVSGPSGMLTVDGCDFPKKGNMSVGVKRQYCGRLGKVDNCQAGVFLGYASEKGYGLVEPALYLPREWLGDDYAAKRQKCRVPEDAKFMTKNEIAALLIRKTVERGLFQAKYVGFDSAFGNDGSFRDNLPEGLVYFADIQSSQKVFARRPEMILPDCRGGRARRQSIPVPDGEPVTVKALVEMDDTPWTEVVLGIGSKGPFIALDKRLRVVESRDGKPGKDVWLYVRELENGALKYSLCNESMDASFEAVRAPAIMRWSIEQSFKECKDNLGMDHYEVRSWTGWRRHMLMTLITHLFVNKVRHRFGFKVEVPLPAPYVKAPVRLPDYVDAVISMRNNKEITHPNILSFPEEKQLFTFSNWANLLSDFFPRMGEPLELFMNNAKKYGATFESEARRKADLVIVTRESGENQSTQ